MRGAFSLTLAVLGWTMALGPPVLGQTGEPGPAAEVLLRVGGEVPRPLALTAGTLGHFPRATVSATDRDGRVASFEGVALGTLLRAAEVGLGERLRGARLAEYVLIRAADDYRVVFAVPELGPAFADRVVLLADRRNGQPLGADEAPFMVVVPGEKRHSRWIRQVTEISVKRSE